MPRQSKIMNTAVALFASLLMSSVAVGTAVGPAHAVAQHAEASLHA